LIPMARTVTKRLATVALGAMIVGCDSPIVVKVEGNPPPRYQLVASAVKDKAYLVDTQTGAVWKVDQFGAWPEMATSLDVFGNESSAQSPRDARYFVELAEAIQKEQKAK